MTSLDDENLPFVLALTIIRGKGLITEGITPNTEILLCIRNRDTNITHPDVVSVPTQRIPSILANTILAASQEYDAKGKTKIFKSSIVSNCNENGHHELLYIVESLLSRKLDVADALEENKIEFEALLAGNLIGKAEYPNLMSSEGLQMLNVLVKINSGSELFPTETASYDETKWATATNFTKMWPGRDITKAGFTAEQALRVGVCVDGLCISSTFDIVIYNLDNSH